MSDDIEALKAEIDETRAELSETVDELTTRLDPRIRVAEAEHAVAAKVHDGVATAKAHRGVSAGVAAGVVAAVAGVVVLVVRRKRDR